MGHLLLTRSSLKGDLHSFVLCGQATENALETHGAQGWEP